MRTLIRDLCVCVVQVFVALEYAILNLLHRYRSPFDRADEEDVSGKIALITGANSGLGKELALQLAQRGSTVIMACRSEERASAAMSKIKAKVPGANLMFVKLDLEDMGSVRECAAEIRIKVPHINLLVCNAGYMNGRKLERTKGGFEKTIATNHLGHFLLTNLLIDLVKKGTPSRIVVVASLVHRFATLDVEDVNMKRDPSLGFLDFRPYCNSKLCNVLFARELSKRVAADGVNVYSVCPGLIDTPLFQNVHHSQERFWIRSLLKKALCGPYLLKIMGLTPEEGIETVLYCALSRDCANQTGKLYRFRRWWESADAQVDDKKATRLWLVSENLVGLQRVRAMDSEKLEKN